MNGSSIWKKLENKNIKIKYQLEIVRDNIIEIITCYYSNNIFFFKNYSGVHYNIEEAFNFASNKIFDCSNFKILLKQNLEYKEILSINENLLLDSNEQIKYKKLLLHSLEFFYNIFNAVQLVLNSYVGTIVVKNVTYTYKKINNEINKLVKLLGYSFIEFKNPNQEHATWNIYHIIKNETIGLLEKVSTEKNIKDILLELIIETNEIEELKSNLIKIYHEYLENNREDFIKYFGNKITNKIWTLYNDIGILKHKKPDKVEKLSKVKQEDIKDALIWLKDIIIFYFTCFNKKAPDKLFDNFSKINLEKSI